MNVFDILLNQPLGWLLKFIYDFVQNYGVAIILFTILTKLILLPLTIKQQKSMEKMQRVKPLAEYLQQKYKDDPQKLNEETMKMYKKEGVSPAGGCLPLLIQLPILFALYSVIRNPLTYILKLPKENIKALKDVVGKFLERAANAVQEIDIYQVVEKNLDKLDIPAKLDGAVNQIREMNFDFLTLDMSQTPDFMGQITWLWLIPVLAAATAYLSSYVTRKMQGTPEAQQGSMKTMNLLMPLMSAWFCFMLPAGLGLYWITGNLVQVAQTLILHRIYRDKGQEEILDAEEYFRKERNNRKKHQ